MSHSITIINHSSVLLQLTNTTIITDPIYALSLGAIAPRLQRIGIPFDRLPKIQCILISHNHHDHLHLPTLKRLFRRDGSTLILPAREGRFGKRAGASTYHEMNWWQTLSVHDVDITCVPAKHSGRRYPWHRYPQTYNGYIVSDGYHTIYFAGDTGYGEHFAEIGKRYSIDVALLPIGAYKPEKWLGEHHLNPVVAIDAFQDLKAGHFIPIHWGTFKISDEPMSEPPRHLMEIACKKGLEGKIHLLKNGETFHLMEK